MQSINKIIVMYEDHNNKKQKLKDIWKLCGSIVQNQLSLFIKSLSAFPVFREIDLSPVSVLTRQKGKQGENQSVGTTCLDFLAFSISAAAIGENDVLLGHMNCLSSRTLCFCPGCSLSPILLDKKMSR